jgi:hypothetical protein
MALSSRNLGLRRWFKTRPTPESNAYGVSQYCSASDGPRLPPTAGLVGRFDTQGRVDSLI